MKKILISTAGFGEGHNTAARNIRDALELVAADEVSVQVVDLFDRCYGKLNEFLRKAYIAAINRTPRVWGKIYSVIDGTQFVESNMVMLAKMKRSMIDLLSQIEPDAIVSTYPLYNYVIDEVYPEGEPRPFSQITVVTDSITVNSVWYRSASDYFIVANEDTAAVLRAGGVTDDRIRIFGFPVTHPFAEMTDRRYYSSDNGPRRGLYMINSGQEEGNARLIVENDCGRLAPDPDSIVEALDDAFANGDAELNRWVDNISRISKPDASLQIARFILDLAVSEAVPPRRSIVPKEPFPANLAVKSPSILLCDFHSHSVFP